ncbi:hypothetical protein K438DRAFT_1815005 [Mycena galopus ATCC 62051]|nr:hypothetical protein K438DRAFT_1815005 [Mycena galopus ATCC 62051]
MQLIAQLCSLSVLCLASLAAALAEDKLTNRKSIENGTSHVETETSTESKIQTSSLLLSNIIGGSIPGSGSTQPTKDASSQNQFIQPTTTSNPTTDVGNSTQVQSNPDKFTVLTLPTVGISLPDETRPVVANDRQENTGESGGKPPIWGGCVVC